MLEPALLNSEAQGSGSIQWPIYQAYFSACGSIFQWPLVIALLLISQVSGVFTGVWLSWWVDDTLQHWSSAAYIAGYATLSVTQSVFSWAYLTRSSFIGLKASDALFQTALKRVLSAPMRLLTITPVGRLMNLFSNDLNQLDNGVNETVKSFLLLLSIAFTTLLLVCVNFPIVSGQLCFIMQCPVLANFYILYSVPHSTTISCLGNILCSEILSGVAARTQTT